MKKVLAIILIFMTTVISSGCSTKYTLESPYITQNVDMEDEMARLPLSGRYLVKFCVGDIERNAIINQNILLQVRKQSSDSYYWEQDGNIMFFTDTALLITDKILGDGSDYYNNLNIGDTIRVMEYYGFDPNGNFFGALRNDPENKYPYKKLYKISKPFVFATNIPRNQSGVLNQLTIWDFPESDIYMPPYIKSDTDYIIMLDTKYLIDNEEKKVYIYEIYSNKRTENEIPYELCKNIFCYKQVFELSERAYDTAKINLNYEEVSCTYSCSDNYDQYVIQVWEKYGDRVNEG